MNKSELIKDLHKKLKQNEIIYQKWELTPIVNSLLECILENLENGEEVHLMNFGKFSLKYHKPKETMRPKTRQRIQIPARASVVFKPTRLFKPSDKTVTGLAERTADETDSHDEKTDV